MKLFLFKVINQLQILLNKLAKDLYLDSSCESLYPLKKIFYLLKFQAEVKAIPGMVSDQEAQILFMLAASQSLSGNIVEIGSWLGKSTVHLAKACQVSGNGQVYAIDTFKGNPGKEKMYFGPLELKESMLARFKANLQLAGVEDFVKIYPMSSLQASKKVQEKIRLLFIDGCHDYLGAKSDFLLWHRKVKVGGLIIFDDFHSHFPGVVRTVREELLNTDSYQIILVMGSCLVVKKIK